jgi:predicted protein tyrosine phosphatase
MIKSPMNAIHNARNPNQGKHYKCLCVCSAGVLRSPTAAEVLSRDPWNFNTRAVGLLEDFALVPISTTLIQWADIIVVMEYSQKEFIEMNADEALHDDWGNKKKIYSLNIPDEFEFRDPELIRLIGERFNKVFIDS